jgi:hypothetical protein
VAALRLFGGLNAGTPLEIASTPVSAVLPDANARIIRKAKANPVNTCSGSTSRPALGARRWLPNTTIRRKPQAIINRTAIMKAYVGMAKAVPASRIPRRFIAVRIAITAMATSTLFSAAKAQADPRFSTPEDTDTATVST